MHFELLNECAIFKNCMILVLWNKGLKLLMPLSSLFETKIKPNLIYA